ncbi:MAG: mannose-6-phosphate isomerase, class I [Treponema sp.]|jgi:mannose-6-phosphate isomerase|nr:mannose-6-phosphate isomerase, class I [Treponema sp.]
MNELFKLKNTVKHYDWGSPAYIPRLLGISGKGLPWAELWMGVHPGGPSETEFRGKPLGLAELIGGDPKTFLGEKAAEQFGALPFLFKFLAASKPLSIQAHPNQEQAWRGFDRENREGIALNAPNRNYKDSNHKPEILCALSPFAAMCGFREPEEIRRGLARFLGGASPSLRQGMSPLPRALAGETAGAVSQVLRNFFSALFTLSAGTRQELTRYIKTLGAGAAKTDAGTGEAVNKYMAVFAEHYPGDPAIIAPLYLNLLELRPGEAVYLEAGVLHAYIEGFAVELMANSDNVLRGGLTPKHIDVPELMRIIDFSPRRPEIQSPGESAPLWYSYAAPCGEFSLSVMNSRDEERPFPGTGPAILAISRGQARFFAGGKTVNLSPGESVFIPPRSPGELLSYAGAFTAYVAALPVSGAGAAEVR